MAGTLTITFKGAAAAQPRDVTLTIKDYCTGALLPSAAVVISGPNGYQFSGLASQTATISLSQLLPGVYNVITTKAGYLPSDEDALANDTFTL